MENTIPRDNNMWYRCSGLLHSSHSVPRQWFWSGYYFPRSLYNFLHSFISKMAQGIVLNMFQGSRLNIFQVKGTIQLFGSIIVKFGGNFSLSLLVKFNPYTTVIWYFPSLNYPAPSPIFSWLNYHLFAQINIMQSYKRTCLHF